MLEKRKQAGAHFDQSLPLDRKRGEHYEYITATSHPKRLNERENDKKGMEEKKILVCFPRSKLNWYPEKYQARG